MTEKDIIPENETQFDPEDHITTEPVVEGPDADAAAQLLKVIVDWNKKNAKTK